MTSLARPTKFRPEYVSIAKKMSELGAVEAEIAEALEITTVTLWRWKRDSKEFCNALKLGKKAVDERIKTALVHRALGYSHAEDDIRVVNNEIVITPTVKHYPPDTTAAIFWLKNRLPGEFRVNPEPSDDGYVAPVQINVSVTDCSVSKPKS